MSAGAHVTDNVMALETYDMSEERGFLCRYNVRDIQLSGAWQQAAQTALSLPDFIPTGDVRSLLSHHLPQPDALEPLSDLSAEEIRMAFVHYSFMVQAYVWGTPTPPEVLPKYLAQPMVALADKLGQQPLLTYSSYVLDNWALIDPAKPIALDNIRMVQNFLAGQDEAWFVLVHVAIEAQAGAILARIAGIIEAAKQRDLAQAENLLIETAAAWSKINAIFDRMPERCDPYIYFERVRPYIHGWANNPALPNGIIYEGVAQYGDAAQAFRGQTGSQSSIVPSMDALLGIGHAADPLKSFLDELHEYRPTGHRRFIDDVRAASTLRKVVKEAGGDSLKEAYNANVLAVASFRTRHLEYAASYINKQGRKSEGNDTEVGTGGTPFMRYLKKHRDEANAHLL